jgi:hypothetical protein
MWPAFLQLAAGYSLAFHSFRHGAALDSVLAELKPGEPWVELDTKRLQATRQHPILSTGEDHIHHLLR